MEKAHTPGHRRLLTTEELWEDVFWPGMKCSGLNGSKTASCCVMQRCGALTRVFEGSRPSTHTSETAGTILKEFECQRSIN